MRRITLWLFSTVVAVVLLFSYRTSTMGAGGATNGTGTGEAEPTPSATARSGTDGTYQGALTQTRWGPIQVTITVADGRITDVTVPTYPNGNPRDEEINAYALPTLQQATLAAQSADIDSVSGATVTSDGYRQSLQAAIDAAQLS